MSFSKEFLSFQYSNILIGRNEISENMKILLYRLVPDYFELLDFDNEDVFLDPLLFAYFHHEIDDTDILKQIVYGSIDKESRPNTITVKSDRYGNIYLSNLGWIVDVEKSKKFKLENINGKYFLDHSEVNLEKVDKENKLNIELLKYPIELFDDRFYDADKKIIDVTVTDAYNGFSKVFNNGIDFITTNAPWLAGLINKSCLKSLIFNDFTDPINGKFCKRNSFASIRVKCVSFHNIYQPWYDEIFFLDDISHQMGHVIFTLLTNTKSRFYKVDPEAIIRSNSDYGKKIDQFEDRNYEVIFHALYTYFLTLNILDIALDSGKFNTAQKEEIKGRIAFYLRKCSLDFELLEDFDKNDIAKEIYTDEGFYIYINMKKSFAKIYSKYQYLSTIYSWDNHSYNYNHKKFLEANGGGEKVSV